MPHDITAAVGAAAFWAFVAVCVACGAAQAIFRNRETQKTIRQAIEKGQTLDPATLDRLLEGSRPPKGNPQTRFGLALGGAIMICIGVGFALMGMFISMDQPGQLHTFLGIACLIAMIGAPLLIASLFVPKSNGSDRR